jgi:eukaryotic-like serine/threonine-protein kinase
MSTQETGIHAETGSVEAYEFGPFRVDVPARRLSQEDKPISLPSRMFDLLVCFLQHQNQIVDRDALIRAGWSDAFVTEDSLTHGISVLRRALGDDPGSPRFIVTVPRRGYQFIGSAKAVLPEVPTAPSSLPDPVVVATTVSETPRRPWWLWAGAGVVSVIATLATMWGSEHARLTSVPGDMIRLAQLPPAGTIFMSGGVLSPDGQQMAFVARDRLSDKTLIWVRPLSSPEPRRLEGAEGASKPFWSPRTDALGYFVGNKLMVVALGGGPPRNITSAIVGPNSGTWGGDDIILVSDSSRGIYAVSVQGGELSQLTSIDPGFETVHAWPQLLPGGHRFLYSVLSKDPKKKGTWIDSVDPREESRILLQDVVGAVYSQSGHLLYVQHNTLLARPFDASTLEFDGEAHVVATNVPEPRLPSVDPVSVAGGVLSFRPSSAMQQLTWFDRTGRRIAAVPTPLSFHNPALSSDERSLLASGRASEDPGLWIIDLDRNVSTRLEADGIGPTVSRDNTQVAYVTRGLEIRVRNLTGPANERVLFADGHRKTVQDWSPDGRYLVFSRMDAKSGLDLWLLPLTENGAEKPVPLLATPASERQASISPDGRWIAYTSDESGALEVYAQEFPVLGSKRMLSSGGGAGPAWARGGAELLYLSTDRRVMSVEFGAAGVRTPGKPAPLFTPPLAGDVWQARNFYVASRDGQRFLFNAVENTDSIPITVMVNWLTAIPSRR